MAKELATENKPVEAVTVGSNFIHPIKEEAERRARIDILHELHDRGLDIKHSKIEIRGNSNYNVKLGGGATHQAQPFMWLTSLLPHLKENDNVFVSYLAGESFIHVRDKIDKLFNNALDIMGIEGAKIIYPYLYTEKEAVIQTLYEENLYETTWYCEQPEKPEEESNTIEPCGYCNSCHTHQDALSRHYVKHGERWVYEYLIERYRNILKEPSEIEVEEEENDKVISKEGE